MSSMTARNADSAKEANHLAIKSRTSAENGSQAMDEMHSIMKELNSGNDKVLSIIKSIDEIAFQTNLLALNAAVEAARAGEHGKGFAVVAQEVRSLAQRCAVAAKETAGLIHSRVECTERATKVTDKLSIALNEIVVDTKKVTDLAGEIAAGSQEQADGTGQLTKATSQMDQVTQNNAATAEELASSSEELSAQAKSLEDKVYELAKEIGTKNTNSDKSEHSYTYADCDQQTHREDTVRSKNNKSKHTEDEDTIIFDVKKKNNGHRKFNREKINHNRQISDEVIPMDDFKGF